MSESQPVVPAGWYSDPQDAHALRFWDGSSWTDQVTPVGQVPLPREGSHAVECYACGRATTDVDTCGACGFPVARPGRHPKGRVGSVLDVKRWPRRTRALVLTDSGDTLTALVRSGPITVTAKEARAVDQFTGREDLLTGVGVLLDLANRPQDIKRLQLPFAAEQLRQACARAEVPAAETVAVAIDALWLQEEAQVARLLLPPGCVAALDLERTLQQELAPSDERYAELPPGRFGRLVAPTARWLLAEHPEALPEQLRIWLQGFGSQPMARLMLAAFDRAAAVDPAVVGALQDLPDVPERTISAYEQLTRNRLPLYAARQVPWLAVAAALAGVRFDPRDLIAAQPGLEVLDDLVDAGALTAEHLPQLESSVDTTYLTARLAPERLDLQQLQELRFVDELERRAQAEATGETSPPQRMTRRTQPSAITVREAGERAAQQLLQSALRAALSEPRPVEAPVARPLAPQNN